jgi:hypothetical protein
MIFFINSCFRLTVESPGSLPVLSGVKKDAKISLFLVIGKNDDQKFVAEKYMTVRK